MFLKGNGPSILTLNLSFIFLPPFFSSLYDSLIKFKEEGWKNVSNSPLHPNTNFSDITKLKNPGLRSHISTSVIFRRIISDRFLQVLADGANAEVESSSLSRQGPKPNFSSDDFLGLVSMILYGMGDKIEQWDDFVRDPNREVGPSIRIYKSARSFLNYRYEDLFSAFNDGLKETIEIGGSGAIDESMVPWGGESPYIMVIPRKPKSRGFRFFNLCFPLGTTGQPVIYHLLPDLRHPSLGGREVLDCMKSILPQGYSFSITADSYFGSPSWLNAQTEHFFTLALSSATDPSLFQLFSYKLGPNEFRTFSNGRYVITLWQDNCLVVSASNLFSPTTQQREGRYRGANLSDLRPTLSLETVEHLAQLPLDQLKIIAKMCGKPFSGTCQEIAYRIGGRLPPSPAPSSFLEPSSSQSTQPNQPNQPQNENNPLHEEAILAYAKDHKLKELQERCLQLGLNHSCFSSPSFFNLLLTFTLF